jgi:perosamine synthetase
MTNINKKFIPVSEPFLRDTEREFLMDAFDSGWISASGPYNKKLEDEFSKFCGVNYGSTVSNGTVAIHLAVRALELQKGDEVIVPNFNGIYGAYALMYEGVIPVTVDAEFDTWNIDPELIEEKITNKTKAIMVVHLYGHPCDMDRIQEIADKYNLPIIEDAAEAHGAEYKSKKAGSLGDISTFSLYANKIMTSGEGGMVLTNDKKYYEKIEYLKNQCFSINGPRNFIHEDLGYNYRYTNLQAAIAYAQFIQLDELNEKRIEVNKKYREALNGIEGLTFQVNKDYAKNVFWMSSLLIDKEITGFSRNQLEDHLLKNNIQTRRLFVGMHRQPVLKKYGIVINDDFPISDKLTDNGLYLPTSPQLNNEEIERIAREIKILCHSKN